MVALRLPLSARRYYLHREICLIFTDCQEANETDDEVFRQVLPLMSNIYHNKRILNHQNTSHHHHQQVRCH